jgi:murein DD-endopeptidase MepM/ murein hydrolase activator NlpD
MWPELLDFVKGGRVVAHFYGTMVGQAKNPATARGTKKGGLYAHLRGWSTGVKVFLQVKNEEDIWYVYESGGSNGSESDRLVATNDPEEQKNVHAC